MLITKIENNKKGCSFKDLNTGEYFICENYLFIKILDSCKGKNAICLPDGEEYYFFSNNTVIPVEIAEIKYFEKI